MAPETQHDEERRQQHAAAQARYNQRKRRDWVRKSVWIPRKFEAEFDRFVSLERYRWGALWDD